MTEPTDAELIALLGDRQFSTIGAVREALRRWGTPPAGAGEHKPGCPALGGYGHGVGECCCGTTPQPTKAQSGAVPLTDEQIVGVMHSIPINAAPSYHIAFARAIEQAHGIGETP